jgi:hypothetical protein
MKGHRIKKKISYEKTQEEDIPDLHTFALLAQATTLSSIFIVID